MASIIELKDISIETNQNAIIQKLNLTVEKGEWLAISGPSGSGKSTVLKYLAQLHDPELITSGSYFFEEKNALDMDPVELRQQISYCYQSPTLFGDTVRDNLAFGYQIRNLEFDEATAIQMLEHVDLSATYLDHSINTLSGGEKQRVALIRNVLFEPKVLLLDEITSALDDKTRAVIWQHIKGYHQRTGITIIMVSHLAKEREFADRIIDIPKLNAKQGGSN